jgi:3-isopropylmalate/(R)-2-methylmalate dehydratase small subunit
MTGLDVTGADMTGADMTGVEGRVWRFGHDVNTDLIQPIHAILKPVAEQPRYVFEAQRPGWVDEVRPGDVIVAGRNFGTGSGRPAARVLRDLGIAGVICDSINGLFFRNCVNFAFAGLECPGAWEAFEEGQTARLDLTSGRVENLTTGTVLTGRPWARELLEIHRHGGLIEQLRAEGLMVEK